MAKARAHARRYMPDRISVGRLGTAGALIAGAIAFAGVLSLVVTYLGEERPAPHPARAGHPPSIEAPVRLQPSPERDMAAFRDEKRRQLETYGWVDAGHGIARIPIDRAMTLLVQQGKRQAP